MNKCVRGDMLLMQDGSFAEYVGKTTSILEAHEVKCDGVVFFVTKDGRSISGNETNIVGFCKNANQQRYYSRLKANEIGRHLSRCFSSKGVLYGGYTVQVISFLSLDDESVIDIWEGPVESLLTKKGGSAILRHMINKSRTFDIFLMLDGNSTPLVLKGGIVWTNQYFAGNNS